MKSLTCLLKLRFFSGQNLTDYRILNGLIFFFLRNAVLLSFFAPAFVFQIVSQSGLKTCQFETLQKDHLEALLRKRQLNHCI